MFNKISQDIIIYTIPGLLSRFLSLLLVPFFTRYISPEDYGALDLIVAGISIFGILLSLQVNQAVPKFLGQTNDHRQRSRIFWSANALVAISHIAFAVLVIVGSDWLSILIVSDARHSRVLEAAACLLVAQGVLLLCQDQLRWLFLARAYLAVSVTNAIASFIVCGYLVVFAELGILGVIVGQIFAVVLSIFISFFHLRPLDFSAPSLSLIGRMVRFSLPLTISAVVSVVGQFVDRIMLAALGTIVDVGYYGIGLRFAALSGLVFVGVQAIVMPIVYKYSESDLLCKALAEIQRAYLYIMVTVVYLYFFCIGFAFEHLVDAQFQDSLRVVYFLFVSFMFAPMYVLFPGIWVSGRTQYVVYISLSVLIFNIILNIIFIPYFGSVGAALATSCAAFANVILFFVFGYKFLRVDIEWGYLLLFLLALASGSGVMAFIEFEHEFTPLMLFALIFLLLIRFALLKKLFAFPVTSKLTSAH